MKAPIEQSGALPGMAHDYQSALSSASMTK
jgi:hypothetical protein